MYEIPTKSKLTKLLKISPVVPGTHLNGRCCKKAYGKIRSVQLFFTQKCLVKDIRKKTHVTTSEFKALKVNLTGSWFVVTPICLNFLCNNLYLKHELNERISFFILRITLFKSSLLLLRRKLRRQRYLSG